MRRIRGYTQTDKQPFILDCDKIYILPMIRSTSKYPNEIEDIIECTVSHYKDGYIFKSILDGYDDKLFVDSYVEFLLFTKYIKEA